MQSEVDKIPDDILHLKDFPYYDSSLQDNPQFRQNLTTWANKTEKLAVVLDGVAEGFSCFCTAGAQQHGAALSVIKGLQEMSEILQNSSPTITESINQLADSLTNTWQSYNVFLNQTEMLIADPIKKMARKFTTLRGLYEELQRYRREFIMAADEMCACRHILKLKDTRHFNRLAEECYNAQKTYQLVLSGYLAKLKEAHTVDITVILNRLLEHFFSIYSFHHSCTLQMKDLEVYMNQIFNSSKKWKMFYSDDMDKLNELQRHVKKVVMFDYQHQIANLFETTSR
jgi:hypothetical protein